MGLFSRKKTTTTKKEPEPEGRANLAKQISANQIHIEKPATKQSHQTHTTDPAEKMRHLKRIAKDKKYDHESATPSTTTKPQGQPFYQFDTRLKPYRKHGRGWYIGIGVFFAAIIGLNIYLGYYMSAVVLLLLATLLFVNASQSNPPIQVSLFTNGLKLGDKFYPWTEFQNFWILYEPPGLKQLHLKRHSKIIGELVIELLDEHPLKIRDLLLPLLPEDPTKEERNIDLLSRTFKL